MTDALLLYAYANIKTVINFYGGIYSYFSSEYNFDSKSMITSTPQRGVKQS